MSCCFQRHTMCVPCSGRTSQPRVRARITSPLRPPIYPAEAGTGPPSRVRLVLAPFAVDQAAVRCSCGHENVGSSVVPVSLSWTVTGKRTTVTRTRRERPAAVTMSLQFSRVLTKRAVAHDVEARFATVVAPGRGARHPIDRVHCSSVPGAETRRFSTILEVKLTDQQRAAQAPRRPKEG